MTLAARLVVFVLLAIAAVGCDSREDPFLLNPPLPDSARVRVVNLLAKDQVDLLVAGTTATSALAPMQVSAFHPYLFVDQVPVYLRHGGLTDTLQPQSLTAGSYITYFAVRSGTRATLVSVQSGDVDEKDLTTRNVGRIVMLNAVDDSTGYYLKVGCQSGDTIIHELGFGTTASAETSQTELSLYLFNTRDSVPITDAHIHVANGAVVYVIAASTGSGPQLFQLSATGSTVGPLPPAARETENTATVELLNAVGNGQPISASIGGVIQVANDVQPLEISPSKLIQACVDPRGDLMAITSGNDTSLVPTRLAVRSHILMVAYTKGSAIGMIPLSRNTGVVSGVHLRVVNASSLAATASISFGAGAPSPWERGGRPFPNDLNTGDTTAYALFQGAAGATEVTFPIILRTQGATPMLLSGVQTLPYGYYTLFIVDNLGAPAMRLLRDDQPGTALTTLTTAASVLFFNMMSDANAHFTIGNLTLPDIAYSYVLSTALPATSTLISSNAGNATIDLSTNNYTIGATGSGGDHTLLTFPGPTAPIAAGKTAMRALNAVKGSGDLRIYLDNVDASKPPLTTVQFGTPSESFQLDARRYSILVTDAGNNVLARADGIELTEARNYLLIVGPKASNSTSPYTYATLLMQE
jgi:hypothetical protein